jgi:hypothetical protein
VSWRVLLEYACAVVESCPVEPLLRLSLVGSQPMGTLLGELESSVRVCMRSGGILPGPAATQAVIGRLTANGDIAR